MKPTFARGFALAFVWVALSSWAHAHPGHDDHELTWDFGHLAAHPLATLAGFGVLLTVGIVGWYLLRRLSQLRSTSGGAPQVDG